MNLTATNYAMMLYGLEDYNHRIGPPIEFSENAMSLDVAPSTSLFAIHKYLSYCESFGYEVTVEYKDFNFYGHIANE